MAVQPNDQRPFRYAYRNEDIRKPKTVPALEPGRVLMVRGRTNTEVYHTHPKCCKIRGRASSVKQGFAEASGLRSCVECPHTEARLEREKEQRAQRQLTNFGIFVRQGVPA